MEAYPFEVEDFNMCEVYPASLKKSDIIVLPNRDGKLSTEYDLRLSGKV